MQKGCEKGLTCIPEFKIKKRKEAKEREKERWTGVAQKQIFGMLP